MLFFVLYFSLFLKLPRENLFSREQERDLIIALPVQNPRTRRNQFINVVLGKSYLPYTCIRSTLRSTNNSNRDEFLFYIRFVPTDSLEAFLLKTTKNGLNLFRARRLTKFHEINKNSPRFFVQTVIAEQVGFRRRKIKDKKKNKRNPYAQSTSRFYLLSVRCTH